MHFVAVVVVVLVVVASDRQCFSAAARRELSAILLRRTPPSLGGIYFIMFCSIKPVYGAAGVTGTAAGERIQYLYAVAYNASMFACTMQQEPPPPSLAYLH